jgi:hypothetical protein
MPTPTRLASPFWVLLLIFAVIRLVAGARGVPYENTRIAAVSIVTLTWVAAALTAALARGLASLSLKDAAKTGALMGLYAQVVIFALTMISIAAGLSTYFNNPAAVNELLIGKTLTFADALPPRLGALVIGPIISSVAAMIGWVIGGVMNMNIGIMRKG